MSKSNNVRSKNKVLLTAANIGLQQLTGAKTLAFTDRKVHDILKMSPQYRYHQREVSFADLFTYLQTLQHNFEATSVIISDHIKSFYILF